jgi:hypothetical protein
VGLTERAPIPIFFCKKYITKHNTTKFHYVFNDSYPEEFVIQVQTISERLASNYVNSIERIIYYVDNVDSLGKDYQKTAFEKSRAKNYIENYMDEKNEDWVKRYKPRKMDRKWIL